MLDQWLAVFEKWMRIYAGMYHDTPTIDTLQGFKIGLGDCRRPLILDRAFNRAMKAAKNFRPDVAQIIAAYDVEAGMARPWTRFDDEQELTKEERERVADNVRAELHKKFPAMFK